MHAAGATKHTEIIVDLLLGLELACAVCKLLFIRLLHTPVDCNDWILCRYLAPEVLMCQEI
jgi:uncharacterized membrane protein YhdT